MLVHCISDRKTLVSRPKQPRIFECSVTDWGSCSEPEVKSKTRDVTRGKRKALISLRVCRSQTTMRLTIHVLNVHCKKKKKEKLRLNIFIFFLGI